MKSGQRVVVVSIMVALFLLGCAGKDGPMGPAGPQGEQGERGPADGGAEIVELRRTLRGSYESPGIISISDTRISNNNVLNIYVAGTRSGIEFFLPIGTAVSMNGDLVVVKFVEDQAITANEAGARIIQMFYGEGAVVITDTGRFLLSYAEDILDLSDVQNSCPAYAHINCEEGILNCYNVS